MAWHPERMTSNEILQATLPIFRTPFLVILAFIGLIAVWHGITVLSRVWTNAEPLPMNQKSIPSWIFKTLTKPTLPRLDEEGWQKQTVLISGGARGLGAMLAIRLAERGAKVITLDVGKTTVKHPNLSAYHCDISKQINVASVARNIIYRHGSPTMLINNAGIRHGFPLLDLTTSAISKYVAIRTYHP
ncbi:oxidoreductase [Malassezia pachydermatis]